jgi:hypothetical protein
MIAACSVIVILLGLMTLIIFEGHTVDYEAPHLAFFFSLLLEVTRIPLPSEDNQQWSLFREKD